MKQILISLVASLPLLLATLPATAADEVKKPYPLDTCVVSGEKLGEMGDPYVIVYEGQEMKFCCKDCYKKFKKDPEKYLEKLEKASDAHSGTSHEGHQH